MTETFADLPDALVRDLLNVAEPVAAAVRTRIEKLRNRRNELRAAADDRRLVRSQAELERPKEPSVAAIDGSYQLHRLTSLDLCGAAAVAVEGTSKEATRHWPEPRHRIWTRGIPHSESTALALRGLMMCMELDLAGEAPHDVVLLDGAFASLIIYLNQGLASVTRVDAELGDELVQQWRGSAGMDRLVEVLSSSQVAAAPKFTSRNELVTVSGLPPVDGMDGRTLATMILKTGEFTVPVSVYGDEDDPDAGEMYHLPEAFAPREKQRLVVGALREVSVIYYRPWAWVPALRLEVPRPIANSEGRLARLLEGIRSQFFSPAVVEPYPLFLADRMVKSLGAGVAVVEQQVAQHVAENGVDAELTMLFLNNYRTEGGRG